MRGIATGGKDAVLYAHASDAETSANDWIDLTSTGFTNLITSGTCIYIAIRRGPMRVPESGTEVFDVVSQTPDPNLTGTKITSQSGVVDAVITTQRTHSGLPSTAVVDRMRGGNILLATNSTAADNVRPTYFWYLDHNDGLIDNYAYPSGTVTTDMIYWMFRRAPGFFDVVAYTGVSGADTVSHNLNVVPEMIWVKSRTEAVSIAARGNWVVYHKDVSSGYLNLHNDVALQTADATGKFGNGSTLVPPTDTNFTVADDFDVGRSANNYIAYLFATLPGVSKVGSYTGNGTSQTINCGFTSGARFILIKRTDSTGDWYVWDTERGIVTGNDPHLSLNTTAAEVTSDDSIDPGSSGFIVNQVAATNVNVSSASYIFLAIA
jgi:hypothetical protein